MRGHLFLLKKARGCPSWDNTAPIAPAKASVSTTKVLVKSGKISTDAVVILAFNSVKATAASVFHVNFDERSKSVSGATRVAYCRTKRW